MSGITSSIARKLRTVTALLTLGTVADGEYLRRSGTSVVGGPGGAAGIGGSTGATDNAILRADGTGGATLQNSGVTVSDAGLVTIPSGGDLIADTVKIGEPFGDAQYAALWHKDQGNPTTNYGLAMVSDATTIVNGGPISFRVANVPKWAINAGGHFVGVAGAALLLTPSAFAALPAGSEGMMAWVNDSSTATWGDTITGGGANKVLAVFNGANWTVAGK